MLQAVSIAALHPIMNDPAGIKTRPSAVAPVVLPVPADVVLVPEPPEVVVPGDVVVDVPAVDDPAVDDPAVDDPAVDVSVDDVPKEDDAAPPWNEGLSSYRHPVAHRMTSRTVRPISARIPRGALLQEQGGAPGAPRA